MAGSAVELVVPGKVAQLRLSRLDRADGADKIGKLRFRRILLRKIVLAAVRNVIVVVGDQKQVVRVAHVERRDHLFIEALAERIVLQLARAQGHQELVLLAFHHLLRGKHNVDQILIQRSGQRLAQKLKIFFRLRRRHQTQRFVQIGDDLAGAVDKAAVNMANRVFLRLPPAAQLAQFFLIHRFFTFPL